MPRPAASANGHCWQGQDGQRRALPVVRRRRGRIATGISLAWSREVLCVM
jgi:hypothetical protein